MTVIIIAFVSVTYGSVILALQILAEKIDALHDKFDKRKKEDQDGQR